MEGSNVSQFGGGTDERLPLQGPLGIVFGDKSNRIQIATRYLSCVLSVLLLKRQIPKVSVVSHIVVVLQFGRVYNDVKRVFKRAVVPARPTTLRPVL